MGKNNEKEKEKRAKKIEGGGMILQSSDGQHSSPLKRAKYLANNAIKDLLALQQQQQQQQQQQICYNCSSSDSSKEKHAYRERTWKRNEEDMRHWQRNMDHKDGKDEGKG